MDDLRDVQEAAERLDRYVRARHFAGYDPYDALMGRVRFGKLGKWPAILAIQFLKRCPINVRPVLGIPRAVNPKALGLLLDAYTRWSLLDGSHAHTADLLASMLLELRSPGYSGACWGYPFDWASPAKFLPAGTPSAVVSGFAARGLHGYYRLTGDERAAEALRSAARFVLSDLPRTELDDGLCFSYTPVARDCCYNASLLAAELLARAYDVTDEADLREAAVRAAEFVVGRQRDDGRWNYSLDVETGRERRQVDFHQGFVLDSLRAIVRFAASDHADVRHAIRRGARFYRKRQFTPVGRARWRLPAAWPADIHHQAQGILTFSRLGDVDDEYPRFAASIARWTIHHMQDASGYFYYRKGRFLTNKISFMRWGQAWMLLALATLMGTTRGYDEIPVLSGTSGALPPVQTRHPIAS